MNFSSLEDLEQIRDTFEADRITSLYCGNAGRYCQVGFAETWRGESRSGMFGGNSNGRGPVWFTVNYLIIESLQSFHKCLGDDFKVECPTGSGVLMNLDEVAAEISRRLTADFLRDAAGRRAVFGHMKPCRTTRTGVICFCSTNIFTVTMSGLGASHQTGWTALVATLLRRSKK